MRSKLTIKRPERCQRCLYFNFIVNFTYSGVFIVNFEHISNLGRREKCQIRAPTNIGPSWPTIFTRPNTMHFEEKNIRPDFQNIIGVKVK